jgi:signal transduction histidine kinase/ActR/RegA family two-component response regulator
MDAMDQASLRVLRWRVEGLLPRTGQAILIAGLLWLQTRSALVLVWLAACLTSSVLDAALSQRCLANLADRRLARINDLSRAISATAFAAVCFVILIDRTGFALAAAMLAGCAINLNNAVMTLGSRRFVLSLVTPSSSVLVAVPLVAWITGHPISLESAAILTVGAAAYTVFTARLASSLFKEGERLRAALEAAEAASRAKSSFLAVTSHEIRTPLNGVLGMAQAMAQGDLSDVQRERIGVIRQAGQALLEILNDILDLSKIEAGKLDLETAPFDLEAVTRSALGAFSATALAKGLDYGLDFDPAAAGTYEGDAARVRQVLCNLVSNAVKFTAEGSVRLCVEPCDEGVRLAVRDTGPGVPEGFAERLFEKFTQADSSTTRRFGGTGLGLAICRELSEAMGGTISVTNALDRGAIFTVELPLARSARSTVALQAAAPPMPILGDRPLRALAAEDNAVNRLVLRTLLEQIGVEATIVDDGAEAVSAWEGGDFDLILMDIQMPRMDGPDAARAIRAREAETGRRRIPIVALTANVMSHQVEAYAAAGMDAFVAKPIVVAELYAAISRCCGDSQAEASVDGVQTASR